MFRQKLCGLLAAVIMVVGCWPGTATAECVIEPDCSGKNAGEKVVDPEDCTKFYYCNAEMQPGSSSFSCDLGEYFEEEPVYDCINGTCTSLCQSALVGCKTTCGNISDFINDPYNCSQYYFCSPGGIVGPHKCNVEAPYFNVVTERCSAEKSVCCDPCTAVCSAADYSEIPDPNDCTRYYVCVAQGPVDPSAPTHGTCYGDVYVPGVGCVSDGQCEVPCPNGTLVVPSTPISTVTTITTSNTANSIPTTTTSPTTTSNTANSIPTTTTSPSTTTSNTANSIPTTTTSTYTSPTTSPSCGLCESDGGYTTCDECCEPEYCYCSSPGAIPELRACPLPMVFNPYPKYPYCVYSYQCPCTDCSAFYDSLVPPQYSIQQNLSRNHENLTDWNKGVN